jgi:hypothetical protein
MVTVNSISRLARESETCGLQLDFYLSIGRVLKHAYAMLSWPSLTTLSNFLNSGNRSLSESGIGSAQFVCVIDAYFRKSLR